jgi:hypothetical protein
MLNARRIAALLGALFLAATPAPGQQLGYKLLGSAGIDAGVQSPPGVYLIVPSIRYDANKIRDQNGKVIPIAGLDMDAAGTAFGAGYTLKTSRTQYVSLAFGIPLARINVSSDNPAASVNGYGFSDLFLQPLKVGWREEQFDIVTAYNVYVPTGKFEPRGGGVGRGYWTHQFSAGGAMYFDSTRTGRVSTLASYDFNTRKRDIDIRRGNMFQIQGGAGLSVAKIAVVGVAGYALWQATRDRGADIPPALLGQWSRAFGLGPEVDVSIPKLRTRIDFRVERDFGVRSRPQGQVISVTVAYLAWQQKAAVPRRH